MTHTTHPRRCDATIHQRYRCPSLPKPQRSSCATLPSRVPTMPGLFLWGIYDLRAMGRGSGWEGWTDFLRRPTYLLSFFSPKFCKIIILSTRTSRRDFPISPLLHISHIMRDGSLDVKLNLCTHLICVKRQRTCIDPENSAEMA